MTRERYVPAPRQAVAAFATDPANDPDWMGRIKRVRVLTDGPLVALGVRRNLDRDLRRLEEHTAV